MLQGGGVTREIASEQSSLLGPDSTWRLEPGVLTTNCGQNTHDIYTGLTERCELLSMTSNL